MGQLLRLNLTGYTLTAADVDNLFVFFCAILVFFMHTGFAMLEAGGVQVTQSS